MQIFSINMYITVSVFSFPYDFLNDIFMLALYYLQNMCYLTVYVISKASGQQ